MTCLQQSAQYLRIAVPKSSQGSFQPCIEGLNILENSQLVFSLVRQLSQAQFVLADRQHSERLWQEAATLNLDPDRIIRLLYGCHDHDDVEAMEAIDQGWRQEAHLEMAKGQETASRAS